MNPSKNLPKTGRSKNQSDKQQRLTITSHKPGRNKTMNKSDAHSERAFVITRVFDAPLDLVFKAWTEAERLTHWWGPKGFKMLSCKLDLRPGGVFHYGMQAPNGAAMWGKWVFREIVAPKRLVFVVSFSD